MPALVALLVAQAFTVAGPSKAALALDVLPLDVAFLDDERLLVLSDETLSLYRIDAARIAVASRLALPGTRVRARAGAGMLRVVAQEGACWALSNQRSGATLFSVEDDRLLAVVEAEAIPPTAFRGREAAPAGVRFVSGTNLLAVGETTLLRYAGDGNAVTPDGALIVDGAPDPAGRRAGDALAVLDDGLLAVSGRGAPDQPDEVVLVRRGESAAAAAWPVRGRIRALGARSGASSALLAVVVETPQGATLDVLDLRWSLH